MIKYLAKHLLTVLALSTFLAGCHIYRMPIQQGRVISDQKLKSIHTGMTMQQVKARLGTPLLSPPYRSNQLVYAYYVIGSNGKKISRTITLTFHANQLSSISSKK